MQRTTYKVNINQENDKNMTLLAGPWVGEFGWELFCWQGHIRNIAKQYQKVIVMGRSGHEFLYEDFCDEYVQFNTPPTAFVDSWRCTGFDQIKLQNKINKIPHNKREVGNNIGFMIYGNGKTTQSDKFKNQKFIKFKSNTIDKEFDILIHPRNRHVGNTRNWSKEKWQKLVNKLSEKYSIGIIGTDEAFLLDNAEDYRKIPIKDTVSLLNRTKLVVGPSSGAMHLASLSGAPHFVWSTPHNEIRYKNAWNPFKTPVYFYDKEGWSPSVGNIYNEIIKVI
jgi:ADP-heptose:LPS heptosyltransferase